MSFQIAASPLFSLILGQMLATISFLENSVFLNQKITSFKICKTVDEGKCSIFFFRRSSITSILEFPSSVYFWSECAELTQQNTPKAD